MKGWLGSGKGFGATAESAVVRTGSTGDPYRISTFRSGIVLGADGTLEDMNELSSANPFDCRSDACIGRIFLVHLSLDANPSSGHLCGRVQHVRSEDATHFASFGELARFIAEHTDLAAGAAGSERSGEPS
jgi:hypothetical protein